MACFNEFYAHDSRGNSHHIAPRNIVFHTNFDQAAIQQNLKKLEAKIYLQPSMELLSDYALNLVKSGKTREAKFLFEALLQEYPNEYALHANVGTCYELLGENEKALFHIRRGIAINPQSHQGSEWIHVKILETKIAAAKNTNYLLQQTVLRLSKKEENNPETLKHLEIQLKERFPFCPEKDPIMSDLTEDLADCYAVQFSFEYAKALYQIAKEYFGGTQPSLDQKIEHMRRLRTLHKEKQLQIQKNHQSSEYVIVGVTGVPYQELLKTHNNTGVKTSETIPLTVLLNYVRHTSKETPRANKQKSDFNRLPTKPSPSNSRWSLIALFLATGMGIFAGLIWWAKRASRS